MSAEKYSFDLFKLYAIAPHFDLVVQPAAEVQCAVSTPPADVSGRIGL
jgi:hypothetical protein